MIQEREHEHLVHHLLLVEILEKEHVHLVVPPREADPRMPHPVPAHPHQVHQLNVIIMAGTRLIVIPKVQDYLMMRTMLKLIARIYHQGFNKKKTIIV
jgi:hypothetical protein